MAITTVARCKQFRGIAPSNTEHDAELARLIEAVQSWLEGRCGRVFDRDTVTEYHDGSRGRNSLMVARPPIISITSIHDDPAQLWGSETEIDPSDYYIESASAGIVRLRSGWFADALRNVRIVYEGGYDPIPSDLEQAAFEMIWSAREKGQHNLIGVRSRSIADGSVQFVNLEWDVLAAGIVHQYRLHTGVL